MFPTDRRRFWGVLIVLVASLFPGLGQPVHAQIIGGGTQLITPLGWRLWKGTNDPQPSATDWRLPGYDDSGWISGRLPIGLDSGSLTNNPALRDMRGHYTTLFLRRSFTLDDPTVFDDATLNGFVIGGAVVWINGEPLTRVLVPPDPLSLTSVAIPPGDFGFGGLFTEFPSSQLVAGTNVLAIRLLNGALTDSNLYINTSLLGLSDQIPPQVDRVLPDPDTVVNSLRQIEIVFSEPVIGVDAADLLANGIASTNVTEAASGDFLFDFPPLPAGPVTVQFRPDHGITDTAHNPNPLSLPPAWSYQLDPAAHLEVVRINEFVADNSHGLKDEDGDRSDWIELRNFGRQSVSLAGWALSTDAKGNPRWTLPDRLLAVGEYLVVFASGKNRTNTASELHTDFKLPKGGGTLLLFKPDGTEAGGFPNYPPQPPDVSYGIVPGATGAVGFFAVATPGGKNSEGGPGFSSEVEFNEVSRTFRNRLTLLLETADPGADIRYTTDQSEPTTGSLHYGGPLTFTNFAIIRARAFTPGLLPGPLHTEAFFPLTETLGAFTSTLPVVVINDFNQGRPSLGGHVPSFIQVFEPGPDGATRLLDTPTVTSRAQISNRGSSTQNNPKMNLRLEFEDEVDEDRKVPFLGLPADGDWILYAPSTFDPALINNAFAHQLSRDIGRYSPRTRFVELYLVTRGSDPLDSRHYQGVYILEERIELNKDRLDVAQVAPGATTAPDVTGGYLFKIDRFGGNDGFVGTSRQQIVLTQPSGSDITGPQQTYLNQYFQTFEDALYAPNFRDPVGGYRPYVDIPSWIDHHLLNVVMFNVDALRLSAYFSKARGGPLAFGPLWDFDRALRSTDGRDLNPRVWRSTSGDRGTDFFNYIWWERLFRDPDFFQDYIDRYEVLRRDGFSVTHLNGLVDSLVAQVREAQPREAKKWGARARGGYPKEIADLKTWLSNRVAFIDGQFVRPPGPFEPDTTRRAHRISFIPATNTTVYYTLDGTDPRLPGGNIAPGALIWDGSLVLATNAPLTARAYDPQHKALTGQNNPPLKSLWSGLVQEPVIVVPPPVGLTEIHFNPADTAGVVDPQDLEFIELHNTSGAAFDFSGFRIRGGIDFTCPTNASVVVPADGRLVVAGNPEVFHVRYPGVTGIVGPFTGRLSNGGDTIRLEGRFGEPVGRVHYQPDWSAEADGGGYSLVPRFEGSPWTDLAGASGWRHSAFHGGSPGEIDAASIPDFQVRVVPAADGVRISFQTSLGRTYTVWVRNDLDPGTVWERLGSVIADPAPGHGEVLDTLGSGPRYYQVSVP